MTSNIQCKMCREIFRDFEQFENHIETHGVLKLKAYTCIACSEVFITLEQLNDHFGKHVEDAKKEFCGDSSSGCCSTQQEMLSVCLMCKKVFLDRKDAAEHQRKQHNQRSLSIKEIPLSCLSQCRRIRGENSKTACICMICKKIFVNKYTCITHVNTYHDGKISCRSRNHDKCYKLLGDVEEDEEIEVQQSEQPRGSTWECCLCGKTLSRKSSCVRHLRKQHGEESPLNFCRKLPVVNSTRSSHLPTKTVCLLCYKVFHKKYNCFQHLLKKHAKDVRICESPGELFVEFISKITTEEFSEAAPEKLPEKSTFQCHICGASLKYRTSLRKHLAKHERFTSK